MPELPEVETIRRYLAGVLTGQTIMTVDIILPRQIKWPDPEGFRAMAIGRTIKDVKRRGKYLLLQLDNDNELIFHLRMTGRLVFAADGKSHDGYTRLLFKFKSGAALIYGDTRTLGAIYGLKATEHWRLHSLASMGPEPLTADFTPEYIWQAAQKRRLAIKTFLLNQEIIGGIGNIYADEALFLAKINPQTKAYLLDMADCERLHEAVNKVIADGIADGGTTFRDYQNGEGKGGHHQEHLQVYGRTSQKCTNCGNLLTKITVGGRGTHFCPHCQPLKEPV